VLLTRAPGSFETTPRTASATRRTARPRPKRPFNPNRFHYTWRWFYDYGCTLVGDWNVHLQDIVHWAMDTYAPLSVSSTGGKYLLKDNRETPDTMEATYEFETPSGQKFCQMFSYTFCCNTPMNGKPYGIQFFGSNGSVLVDREGWETFPDTRGVPDPDNPGKKIRVPRMEKITKPGEDSHIAHAINFLDALKSRKKEDLKCDIEIGYKTAAACHLANMSYKLGRKLFWDGDRGICIRQDGKPDAEANVLLTKEYRAPYTLPKV
jgi:predicted dehydrogenase